jgi:glycine/D-amino acid oxidase-like deaminating enzyme
MDYGTEDFYMDLMEAAFSGWRNWNSRWERPLYHQTGILFLASHLLGPGDFEYESMIRLKQRGVPVETVDHQAIQQQFPAWNASYYINGYYNPQAGWAESGEVVARLVGEARKAGINLYEGHPITGLLESGRKVNGVISGNGSRFTADAVIVAAGSWTPGLLPFLAPVMWPVGQPVFHFSTEDLPAYQPPVFPVWGADIHTAGWYGFPATANGIVKVANHGPGWRVDPRDQAEVPDHAEAAFRAFLRQSLPGLAGAPLARTRLCFYCDTFDGDFWIDHDPEREGLMVCAGGSGHAFKFAPVLGPLIADVFEGKSNRFAKRFAWRRPGVEIGPAERK